MWRAPIDTLGKAGRALEGMEALLGGGAGGTFDLKVSLKADPSLVSLQPTPCHADTTSGAPQCQWGKHADDVQGYSCVHGVLQP